MDLPGHGLPLRRAVTAAEPHPVTPCRARVPCRGGDTHLLRGDGLLAALPQLTEHLGVLPQVGLAAHQQDGDALAEVVHLRVPLWGTGVGQTRE